MNEFENGLLTYLNEEQLTTIQSKKIGIGGAGGLGSNVAMILVRSGFKHIEIIDKDVIDASNLNRQQYFLNEIGSPKVEVLADRLLAINPDLTLNVHYKEWSEDIGEELFSDCDVIVEAFDQANWKFRFASFYQARAPFIVSGNGMAGLLDKKPMSIKKVGNMYLIGDHSTSTHEGHPPMAPRVTSCAAQMAEVVLDLSLGLSK